MVIWKFFRALSFIVMPFIVTDPQIDLNSEDAKLDRTLVLASGLLVPDSSRNEQSARVSN
jgi:hypothetical protein